MFEEDLLQFVEQFLGSADAERRNEHAALVGQRTFDRGLQALAPVGAIFVAAIAIGTLQHQQVGPLRWRQVRQDGRMGRAEIAAEDDSPAVPRRRLQVELHVRRAQHVPGRLQAHLAPGRVGVVEAEPVVIGQRDDALLDDLQVPLEIGLVAAYGQAERIFEHDRQ